MSSIKTFEQNIYFIVSKYNIKLKSIVLHGDVINRRIGIANKYLYTNDLKSKYKLIEMYDIEKILSSVHAIVCIQKFLKLIH